MYRVGSGMYVNGKIRTNHRNKFTKSKEDRGKKYQANEKPRESKLYLYYNDKQKKRSNQMCNNYLNLHTRLGD